MKKYFDGKNIEKKVIIVPEEKPLGTGGAMRNCFDYVTGTTAASSRSLGKELTVL